MSPVEEACTVFHLELKVLIKANSESVITAFVAMIRLFYKDRPDELELLRLNSRVEEWLPNQDRKKGRVMALANKLVEKLPWDWNNTLSCTRIEDLTVSNAIKLYQIIQSNVATVNNKPWMLQNLEKYFKDNDGVKRRNVYSLSWPEDSTPSSPADSASHNDESLPSSPPCSNAPEWPHNATELPGKRSRDAMGDGDHDPRTTSDSSTHGAKRQRTVDGALDSSAQESNVPENVTDASNRSSNVPTQEGSSSQSGHDGQEGSIGNRVKSRRRYDRSIPPYTYIQSAQGNSDFEDAGEVYDPDIEATEHETVRRSVKAKKLKPSSCKPRQNLESDWSRWEGIDNPTPFPAQVLAKMVDNVLKVEKRNGSMEPYDDRARKLTHKICDQDKLTREQQCMVLRWDWEILTAWQEEVLTKMKYVFIGGSCWEDLPDRSQQPKRVEDGSWERENCKTLTVIDEPVFTVFMYSRAQQKWKMILFKGTDEISWQSYRAAVMGTLECTRIMRGPERVETWEKNEPTQIKRGQKRKAEGKGTGERRHPLEVGEDSSRVSKEWSENGLVNASVTAQVGRNISAGIPLVGHQVARVARPAASVGVQLAPYCGGG
ncbi:hypothetical protein HDV00_005362 [Rhizophlyctis rosea]|nr:hypothetical protein HDV00_005362 [Rhizophlyctis rosea]